ncbi:MAG: SPOR domain-containing protein [Pseudomonadales bacterium]|nr:SPOR domain-containing protein [Pseudomonadales bacterium]
MKKTSVLYMMLLVVLASFAHAASTQFWVVGSFESLAAATTEKRRVEGASGLPVRIGTFNREDVTSYRLLVEKDDAPEAQRERLIDAGVSPWTVSMESNVLDLSADDVSHSKWAQYLVLAGFRSEDRAHQFVEQLKSDGISDLMLDEIELQNSPYFRVLYGPFDMKGDDVREQVRAMGITDAWWVTRAVEDRPVEAETQRVVELPVKEEKRIVVPEPEPEPEVQVSAPRPGESYFDYCVKRANSVERSRYCRDGQFLASAVRGEQARQGMLNREQYFVFCAKEADSHQRSAHCTDTQLAEKLKKLEQFK